MAEISDKNNSEIMKKTIVTAIIGYGMGGSVFHAPVISSIDGFKISKIFTRDPLHAAKAKERYPGTEIVEDTDKIFSDPEIELVVIVTPNQYHHPLALKALNAGKNVITDKPFTVAVSQADELISLASEKNLMLSVFHNRRWDADFRTVKKLIEKNVLGHISECEIHYGRYRNYFKNNWKEADLPGSGLVYDIGSHLIDQALSLFGDPDYVWADLRKQRKGSRINDNFVVILEYQDTRVTLKSGMLVKEALPRYIITGEKGMFIKYGMDIQEADLNAGLTPLTKKDWGIEPATNHGVINMTEKGIDFRGTVVSEPGDYREYYRDIYSVLSGEKPGKQPAVTAQQAGKVIKVIELALMSSEAHCTMKFSS